MRAVSTDHPWHRDVLNLARGVANGDLDRLAVLRQLGQFDTALHGDAQGAQVSNQHAFGLGLRSVKAEGIRGVEAVQRDAEQLVVAAVELHRLGLDAGGDQLVYRAHPLQHVQAASMHGDRAGFIGRLGQLVDDAHGHSVAGQFGGSDQAHRPGADDQDIGIVGAHNGSSLSRLVET